VALATARARVTGMQMTVVDHFKECRRKPFPKPDTDAIEARGTYAGVRRRLK